MSSHHVVREKQEPALLVLGLDNFADDLLGQLLEWSPTVITAPQTAEQLNAFGIKIDWIIANGNDDVFQSDIKLISCKGETLIDAAFNFLLGNEYSAVNIVTDDLNLQNYAPFVNK